MLRTLAVITSVLRNLYPTPVTAYVLGIKQGCGQRPQLSSQIPRPKVTQNHGVFVHRPPKRIEPAGCVGRHVI
jgi:hypothetical protein